MPSVKPRLYVAEPPPSISRNLILEKSSPGLATCRYTLKLDMLNFFAAFASSV